MNIWQFFCKHSWESISKEKLLKRKSLRDFYKSDPFMFVDGEYDPKSLEYEILVETFQCKKCGKLVQFSN